MKRILLGMAAFIVLAAILPLHALSQPPRGKGGKRPERPPVESASLPAAERPAPAKLAELPKDVTRVPVVFSDGHETDRRDGGRPVVLIAAALGVTPEVFRDAFSQVRPARGGREPEPAQVRQNKSVLMKALGKHGVTNEKLDAVSNYYRYVRSRGELWPTEPAVANALVKEGAIIGYELVSGGSGYSSLPTVSVPNVKGATAKVEISFGKAVESNGSVSAITVPQDKAK